MIITEEKKNLLKNIPVEQVAEAVGLDVTRHNCLCFNHDDHHPSLVFNTRSNTWKCYACGIYGDSISLVQQKMGLGFIDACMWLGTQFGVDISNDNPTITTIQPKRPAHEKNIVKNKEKAKKTLDFEVLEFVSEKCMFRTADFERFLYKDRQYKHA